VPSLYASEDQGAAPSGLLLGLAAKKQHGKDTMADWLRIMEGFIPLSFADPMKRSGAASLGTTPDVLEPYKEDPNFRIQAGVVYEELGMVDPIIDITVRQFYQYVGTQAHREIPEFGDRVWVDMMNDKVAQVGRYVITDARFENEQREVKALGGYVVQIDRAGMPNSDSHASEQVDHGLADYVIQNDGTLAEFYAKIDEVLADIRASRAVA